jgi:hypothetical protein
MNGVMGGDSKRDIKAPNTNKILLTAQEESAYRIDYQ